MAEIKTLDSKLVYQNKWMSVREDKIERASGAQGIYGVVDKHDFVVILPIDNGHVHLVEQYRYPVKQRFWELPQGAWEDNPDIEPQRLAAAELREETGLVANTMHYVGFQYLAYGMCSQGYHIFVASELSFTERQLDAEEEGLLTAKFTLAEFEHMLQSGQIKDATTVVAYSLAKLKGLI